MKPSSRTPLHQTFLTLLLATAAFSFGVSAADAPPATFATVSHLKGEVTATASNGETRRLQKGESVRVGEKIRSTSSGEAVLQTGDAGIVAVRPNAEFIPERFAAEGKKSDHQILRLISGSLRIISGWIGQLNSGEHLVITPGATIGIRGTDHEPFVLPANMANSANPQGTYDKVNRGATLLDANGGNVTIDSGKVGFARDPNATEVRTRAMMTLLLPVVLTRVPDFYVPGAFDKELDLLSSGADIHAHRQLERLTGQRAGTPKAEPVKTVPAEPAESTATPPVAEPPAPPIVGCPPAAIAEAWLGRLDRAIARKDVKTILGLFAPDIVAKATVQSGGTLTTLEFSRDEMVQSTLTSIASLKDYRQRRVSLEARLAEGETTASCQRLTVKSGTIEQGLMNGKPFRFEALEDYLLEQRNGEWQAVKAHTTQR